MIDLWYGTDGPPDAEIVIIGESWGSEEAIAPRPFVGSSGIELNRMLDEAKIDRRKCLLTNVVADRPLNNETWRFFLPKEGKPTRIGGIAPSPKVVEECRRLYSQITAHPRKLVIATGNWALWAMTHRTGASVQSESNNRKIPEDIRTWAPSGIMDWRGSMWYCEPHPQFITNPLQASILQKTQLLPIIHPAAIMRAWYQRAVTVHDLKARVPLALNNDWRPNPEPIILAPPTFAQACNRLQMWFDMANRGVIIRLANDIETVRRTFISCMGFADSKNFAMCIPFLRVDNPDGSFESYWTPEQEAQLLDFIRKVLTHKNIHIIGQNYIYDIQYIQHWMGITPHLKRDTMLVQNVIFPGTPKALDYLSSLYCKYHWYWKEDHKDWDKLGEPERLWVYNAWDNLRTWEVDESQVEYTKAIGQEEQVEFKMQTNNLCLRMMNRGVLIDKNKRGTLIFELDAARAALYRELETIVPQSLVKPGHHIPWYRSPHQTRTLFYDILGFKSIKHRKTKALTVGKEALMQLERWYPEFTRLFQLLDIAGSVDNSLNVVQMKLESDGRVRCSYNPGGTETHRLSSSENVFGRGTNLQNLTKGEEDE